MCGLPARGVVADRQFGLVDAVVDVLAAGLGERPGQMLLTRISQEVIRPAAVVAASPTRLRYRPQRSRPGVLSTVSPVGLR